MVIKKEFSTVITQMSFYKRQSTSGIIVNETVMASWAVKDKDIQFLPSFVNSGRT